MSRVLKAKVEEVTGVPPDVVRATLLEMDRAKAAFLGELEGGQSKDSEDGQSQPQEQSSQVQELLQEETQDSNTTDQRSNSADNTEEESNI